MKFVELENGEIFKLSSVKSFKKSYGGKFTIDSKELAPYVKVKRGFPIFRLLGLIPIKYAKDDCLKLDPNFIGWYGGWYHKYYYTLKELYNVMVQHWGENAGSGYYRFLPIAEYSAGREIAPCKEALYFNDKENAICVKPYLILYFDDEKDRKKVLVFNTKEELNNKFNHINKQGNLISGQWFDDCHNFYEGFSRVTDNYRWNFINCHGHLLSNQWFDDCFPFSEGFAIVKLKGKWNFIDCHGYILSDVWFDWCSDFNEGFATVTIDGIHKVINKKGEIT